MRKILIIGFKDVKIGARDLTSLIILILMPIILIFVLGVSLQPLFTERPFTIHISVLDEDRGDISKILIDDVFMGDKLKDMIKIKFVRNIDEIKKEVNEGRISAGVIIGRDFSSSVVKGKRTGIDIIANPEDRIKAGVIKNIVDSFILEVLKRRTALETAVSYLTKENILNPREIQELIPEWLSELENSKNQIVIDEENFGKKRKIPPAISYYAVGMAVMYLLFATNAGAQTIFEEKRIKTFGRIMTMPVKEGEILFGKIFGIFLIALLQITIIILFSRFFYGVNWGESILSLSVIVISSVLAFSGFSTLLASISKSERSLGNLSPAISMIFGFLGGSMFPIYSFPKWLNSISKITPHRLALDGFLKLMYDSSFKAILPNVVSLIIMSSIFFLIGIFILKRRGV